jgi:replicative DNA helicase
MYGIKIEGDKSVENIADIIIGKQRNGPTGDVQLSFIKQYARFENLALPTFDDYAPPTTTGDTPF